jgi:protein-S-isoprenylcysteine O-methyltransferase Ste14
MSVRLAWTVGISILFAVRWVEYLALRRKGPKGQVHSPWTTVAILIVGSGYWIAAAIEASLRDSDWIWWVSGIGIGAYAFRTAVKLWAVRTLGRAWSTEVEIQTTHRLVQEGPYRRVRHPIYLCNMLEPVAVALMANAPVAGLLGILMLWPVEIIRLRAEERALKGRFPEAYEEYQRSVPALIPVPWRKVRGNAAIDPGTR